MLCLRHGLLALTGFLLACRPAVWAAETAAADLLVVNGKVWTVQAPQPQATAVAVAQGRILGVGSDAGMRALARTDTKILDAHGHLILPGFYDSHMQLLAGGLRLQQVDLKEALDETDFGRRLREFQEQLPRERWLLGGNWDHDRTLHGRLPTAALLDKYVPTRPAFLVRYDGHMAVVNTRVLQLAGITATTPDPPGGLIERKAGSKEPTGLLRDNAMSLVTGLVPEPSDEELVAAVRAALTELARHGITSAQDMDGSAPDQRRQLFRLYQQLRRSGQLTARIDLRWPLADWRQLADLGLEAGFGDDWVRIGGLKGFVDGSLGSSTAKLFEPYRNDPNNTGVWVTPLGTLRKQILGADQAGLQVAIHAIGNRANAELLDLFDEVNQQNGARDRRFRIEHAQHLRPQDYPRFKALGVLPSLQPYHISDDGRWAEGRLGAQRCAASYANRALLDAGARLAFGSDWPVAPVSPLLGIDAAVRRRTLDGKHPQGWFPEQRLTVAEALRAYTLDAAYAAFQEKERGSLEVGKLADLVVLSRDILDPREREHLAACEVVLTIVGGKVVYAKQDGK